MDLALVQSRRNWIHDFADWYHDLFISRTHPEVLSWPLVAKDWQCCAIMITYVVFINWLGPAIMRFRKPFDLRWLMIPYNIALVIINFYIFFQFSKIRWSGSKEVSCNTEFTPLDPETNPQEYRLAEITWYFYITKYVELIDTVFFVLRKKERQLSRLHIIHHTSIPFAVLVLLRSEPGGYHSFFPLANSFVHCVMYTYYGIAALGDEVTIHLWFKKYVTMIQMIQFILVLYFFISRPLYGCHWNWVIGGGNLFIAGFFFVLFCNFYWNEYCKTQCLEDEQQHPNRNGINKRKEK